MDGNSSSGNGRRIGDGLGRYVLGFIYAQGAFVLPQLTMGLKISKSDNLVFVIQTQAQASSSL